MTMGNKIFYSPKIKQIIDFMIEYHKKEQAYPRLIEIGEALNLSKQRIGILMKNAVKLGLVKEMDVFMRKYHLTKSIKNSKFKVNNYYEL